MVSLLSKRETTAWLCRKCVFSKAYPLFIYTVAKHETAQNIRQPRSQREQKKNRTMTLAVWWRKKYCLFFFVWEANRRLKRCKCCFIVTYEKRAMFFFENELAARVHSWAREENNNIPKNYSRKTGIVCRCHCIIHKLHVLT